MEQLLLNLIDLKQQHQTKQLLDIQYLLHYAVFTSNHATTNWNACKN